MMGVAKIAFSDFERLVSIDLSKKGDPCIEIYFRVDGNIAYQECWMGKILQESATKSSFWFGLTPDGSQAYDYDSFEELVSAKVFSSKSLKEIWDSVSILMFGGGATDEDLPRQLGL